MSTITSLLLPCCSSSDRIQGPTTCCASALTHALTSLVLSIIISLGAVYAAYILMQIPPQTAAPIVGGAACALTLILYISLRCLCRSPLPNKNIPISSAKSASPEPKRSPIKTPETPAQPIKSEEEPTLFRVQSPPKTRSREESQLVAIELSPQPPILQEIPIINSPASVQPTPQKKKRTPLHLRKQKKQKDEDTPRRLIKKVIESLPETTDAPDWRNCTLGEGCLMVRDLKLEHLTRITSPEPNNPKFPWSHFCTLDGIGEKVRALALKGEPQLSLHLIPWHILVKKPAEVNCLFRIEGDDNEALKFLLEQLDITEICQIAPALQAEHLTFLYEKHRKDPIFPWEEFFNKEGIGNALRQCLLFNNDISKLRHIPWKAFASKGPEVRSLFPESNFDGKTEALLKAFPFEQILYFAPHLSVFHVPLFRMDHLNDQYFNWKPFCKEGIGAVLRTLITERNPRLSLKYLPWTTLSPLKGELRTLFQIDPDKKINKLLFQKLGDDALLFLYREKILTELHTPHLKRRQKNLLEKNREILKG